MTSISGTNISGLASGLDTTALVSQLMQAESQPQQLLKNKVSAEQKTIAAYQSVNTRVQALQIASDAMTQAATWQAALATSSSSAVSATASAGAPSGQYTFDVTALARAQVSTAILPADSAATTGAGLDIAINGGTPTHLAITTDTAQGVADAINTANLGVKAMVVNTDQGTVLQFNATKTGTAGSFSIAGLAAATVDQTTAGDAKITVGTLGQGGYTVSSSTNTFTNLVPNVTLTATQVQAGVTLNVASDVNGVAAQMQAMVTAANAALTEISAQSTYTAGTSGAAGTAGTLLSDLGVQSLQQNILGAISNGAPAYGSFQQLGLQLDKTGKFTFDKAAFIAAYQANPAAIQAAVQNGVGKTLSALGTAATNSTTGTLTTAIAGGNDQITVLNDQISTWGTRLADRQSILQKQFSDMEVALGKLKDQANWLTGQIASLPSNSKN